MDHLSNDMLLAYVRQQQLSLWSRSMQDHLAHCLICQGRCAEYAQIGNTIEGWARSSAVRSPVNDAAYAMVANRVLRTLTEEKPSFSHRIHHSIAQVRVILPVAVMLVVLCVALFTVVTFHIGTSTANPNKPRVVPPHMPVQITSVPRQPTATPVPTASPTTAIPGGSIVLVTPTPGSTPITGTTGQASIKEDTPCTTAIDAIENVLHVCGKKFTAGSTVTIEYQIGSTTKKHTMQVSADGSFIDSLDVSSCNEVPTAIYVQSSTNPAEKAQLTKNIIFGMCQSFGKLRK